MFELMIMIIMSLVRTKPYHVQSQVLLILLLILWNKIMLQYLTIRRKGLKEKIITVGCFVSSKSTYLLVQVHKFCYCKTWQMACPIAQVSKKSN